MWQSQVTNIWRKQHKKIKEYPEFKKEIEKLWSQDLSSASGILSVWGYDPRQTQQIPGPTSGISVQKSACSPRINQHTEQNLFFFFSWTIYLLWKSETVHVEK